MPYYLLFFIFKINVLPMLVYSVSQAFLSFFLKKRLQIRFSVHLDPIGGNKIVHREQLRITANHIKLLQNLCDQKNRDNRLHIQLL